MYDLNDLEKKWISYKRQKYKKFGTLALSFVVVSAVSFGIAYAIFAPKNTTQTQSEANLTAQNNATKQVEVNQTQPLQPLSNFASYQTQPIQKDIHFRGMHQILRYKNTLFHDNGYCAQG